MAARVTRFSNLRGVERTLLPSVRQRRNLPTMALGADILARLQRLLAFARTNPNADDDAMAEAIAELERIDETLERFADQLIDMTDSTPIMQLRATISPIVDRYRNEVVSLLELYLERFDPDRRAGPPFLVDFLITLLARRRTGTRTTLAVDPTTVTRGVARRCAERALEPGPRAREFADAFRDAAVQLASAEDLGETIERMRGVKAELAHGFFDGDVLRAVVDYNIAADNRFRELLESESLRASEVDRSLTT